MQAAAAKGDGWQGILLIVGTVILGTTAAARRLGRDNRRPIPAQIRPRAAAAARTMPRMLSTTLQPSLREAMQRQMALLALVSSVLVTAGLVMLVMLPVSDRIAEQQFGTTAERVAMQLDHVFRPVEHALAAARGWVGDRAPSLEDPSDFNRIFRPLIESSTSITSVVAGSDRGEGWLLLRQNDGGWRNRMTDPVRHPGQHRMIDQPPGGAPVSSWRTLDYDPRTRPWYRAADAPGPAGPDASGPGLPPRVAWTAPYTFFTTGEPGITASTRWRLADGSQLTLGLDLKLRDLARSTGRDQMAGHGRVMVLTDDLRVLALPAGPVGTDQQAWLKLALQPAERLGLPDVDAMMAAWRAGGQQEPARMLRFRVSGRDHLAQVRAYPLGGQRFWVVTIAPGSDYLPALEPIAAAWIAGLLLALAAAGWVARVQARRLTRPLERLADASDRIGQLDFERPADPPSRRFAETDRLFAAQERMRSLLEAHQATIAQREGDLREQIAALRRTEEQLRDSEAYAEQLFAGSAVALMVIDPETGLCTDCNLAALALHQASTREGLVGRPVPALSPPAQPDGRGSQDAFARHVSAALQSGQHDFEWTFQRPDASAWQAEIRMIAFRWKKQTLLQMHAQDITERKQATAAMTRLAFFDALTGLPNRALLHDRLQHQIAASRRDGEPIALLFLDLDRFKEINDTQGHDVGDEVLKQVALRFQSVMRPEATIARMGGDEFVVLAPRADAAAAECIAERLSGTLAQPIEVRGQAFVLGVSIGMVRHPEDGATPERLLRHADIAMYRAKAAGGGHRFYAPDMSEGLSDRMMLARDLRAALRGQGPQGQLVLHYQPQVALADGRLTGAEALLRWHHPVLGLIGPDQFIPVAEERGLAVELGLWVLGTACEQLAAWDREGLRLPGRLAINIAAEQLDRTDFVTSAAARVAAAGLSPERLEMEVTESGLMRHVEQAITQAQRLREAGFGLAIDDFGTGYSSLAYLKRLPADRIKIDRSFVKDMFEDRNDHAIVHTIIAMGRTLGMRTVAEGVETEPLAHALAILGCEEAQGHAFGRPEPAPIFARRLRAVSP